MIHPQCWPRAPTSKIRPCTFYTNPSHHRSSPTHRTAHRTAVTDSGLLNGFVLVFSLSFQFVTYVRLKLTICQFWLHGNKSQLIDRWISWLIDWLTNWLISMSGHTHTVFICLYISIASVLYFLIKPLAARTTVNICELHICVWKGSFRCWCVAGVATEAWTPAADSRHAH